MPPGPITRRGFARTITSVAAAAAIDALADNAEMAPLKLSVFSKHLQWAKWDEMAAVAAECGFDGIDLTVRTGGHVEPERVADDLPRAVAAIRKAGLEIPMITAGIVDAASPYAEAILQAASAVGIHNYRWGGFKYNDTQPIPKQLEALKPRVSELAALNSRYNMTAMYHTHSGMEVGAPIWDLWLILRDVDPKLTGINYDIGHATIEGGVGGWIRSAQLSAPYMRGVALKDFRWARNARGQWKPEWCPVGEGMVQFPRFFAMLKAARFNGPLQVHYEYAGLGGADKGAARLGIPKPEFIAKLKRDLDFLRRELRSARLIS